MMFYILSFLFILSICTIIFKILPLILAEPETQKKRIDCKLLSWLLFFLLLFVPLFLTLILGINLAHLVQNQVFIEPTNGISLIPERSEILIVLPTCVVAILLMIFSLGFFYNRFELNIRNKMGSIHTGTHKLSRSSLDRAQLTNRRVLTIVIFVALCTYTIGIGSYAYTRNNKIIISSWFSEKTYKTEDIKEAKVITYNSRDGHTYNLLISFKDNTSLLTGLFNDGVKLIVENTSYPIDFDTTYAEDAFRKKYR